MPTSEYNPSAEGQMILDAAGIADHLDTMALRIAQLCRELQRYDPLMVGIQRGGLWIAQALYQRLESSWAWHEPLGSLDISFYRDDLALPGVSPILHGSSLPCATEGRHVLLVDDVCHTGRTARAALDELFDYGRPASVTYIALVERSGRELPIVPDVLGLSWSASAQHIKLTGPSPLALVAMPCRTAKN
jgi:pyrimidine operon attenuation protein/uracil phosphoribosyltransferase